MQPMNTQEALRLVLPVIEVLERLGVTYRIGGSIASSYYGQPRATQDVDLVADIAMSQVPALVGAFDPHDFVISDQAIIDAILHRTSFNIIALGTMNKVDVFIEKTTALARQEQQRARRASLIPGTPPVWISSVEDMVIEKMLWWRMGGGQSSRQWADIIGLIQTNAGTLDRAYLQATSAMVQIDAEVRKAFLDASIPYP
ncbi:MAG TPA: hypothetical protein VGR57_06755 [Ktedonobacterales bacterium]|nr:hypothetical protein [Ktedonobacterales bacterium]